MKFAHMADCHIGSWRDPKLNDISTKAFAKAVDISIKEKVDFVLIAGDLFNTAVPAIDRLKEATKKLKELQQHSIPVYIVPGSHDYSASGKTMLDVLEHAGLVINVAKGEMEEDKLRLKMVTDKKTGAKITGLLGKRGALEKSFYEALDKESLEKEPGYKIFMFHSLLAEFKPTGFETVEALPLSFFPKGFNYYAGGHVHIVFKKDEPGYGTFTYPGPLFPNSFSELEDLQRGGFYIVEDGKVEWHPIQVVNVFSLDIDAHHKSPEQVVHDIEDKVKGHEFNNTIVTIRVRGTLSSGKPADIDWKQVFTVLQNKSAFFVMKNTTHLTSKEFDEIKIKAVAVDQVEDHLIREHLGQQKMEHEESITKSLMESLSVERHDGERVQDFEQRIREQAQQILGF